MKKSYAMVCKHGCTVDGVKFDSEGRYEGQMSNGMWAIVPADTHAQAYERLNIAAKMFGATADGSTINPLEGEG